MSYLICIAIGFYVGVKRDVIVKYFVSLFK
jgi:hypothetical protein